MAWRLPIVVSRAEGVWIEDVDGKQYIDFAGGIGCQNTGHGLPAAVAAMHEQIDRYLHQCVMVGLYEPYVDVSGAWPSCPARAPSRSRSSSTPAPRQSRTRSRSPAWRRAGRRSSRSTEAFTAGPSSRCP